MASGKVRLSLPAPLGLYLSDRLARPARAPSGALGRTDLPRGAVRSGRRSASISKCALVRSSDSSLICRRIGWTTAFLVAAPAYLERRSTPETPKDIRDHECICYSRAGDGRHWSFSNGSDDISVRIAPRLIANNAVAVHRAALAGAGLAVLSHILAVPDIEAGRLVNVMPDFQPTRLPINVVYPSRRNMPLRVRRFSTS